MTHVIRENDFCRITANYDIVSRLYEYDYFFFVRFAEHYLKNDIERWRIYGVHVDFLNPGTGGVTDIYPMSVLQKFTERMAKFRYYKDDDDVVPEQSDIVGRISRIEKNLGLIPFTKKPLSGAISFDTDEEFFNKFDEVLDNNKNQFFARGVYLSQVVEIPGSETKHIYFKIVSTPIDKL
jgi:hypothetical protein